MTKEKIFYLKRSFLENDWKVDWSEKWSKCEKVIMEEDTKLKITIKPRKGIFNIFGGVSVRNIEHSNADYIKVICLFVKCFFVIVLFCRHCTTIYNAT